MQYGLLAACTVLGACTACSRSSPIASCNDDLRGVYVAGGVCLRLGTLFDRTAFRRRFLDKGRMRTFLEPIPTWLVLRGNTGLIGAAHYRLGD